MLRAYCDCSKREDALAAAAIVVTTKSLIDYDLRILQGVKGSAHGELRALQLVFELINRSFDTPQDVVVYSDCASVVNQYVTSLKTGRIPTNRAYYSDWVKLMEMCSKHKVRVHHLKGHENARTYHTICDYAARAAIC